MTRRRSTGRRRFLKTVGLAGMSSALVAPALSGAPTPPPKPESPSASPDTLAGAKAPELSADALALAGIVERRYGGHLTKEQLQSIARDFDGDLKATKRLREVKLGNDDEPDFVFKA